MPGENSGNFSCPALWITLCAQRAASQSDGKLILQGRLGKGEKVILREPGERSDHFSKIYYKELEAAARAIGLRLGCLDNKKGYVGLADPDFLKLPPDEREREIDRFVEGCRPYYERKNRNLALKFWGEIKISGETHHATYRVEGNKRHWDWGGDPGWSFTIVNGYYGYLFDHSRKADKDGMIESVAAHSCRDDFYD